MNRPDALPSRLARLAEEATKRDESQPTGREVPGAALALTEDGQVAWTGAWGSTIAGGATPVSDATLFEAASLSKPVFAATVLRLAASGILDLDTPLAPLLGEPLVADDPRANRISARMVLSHSTGLQNWLWTPVDRPTLSYEPGRGFSYSSLGHQYLQRAVERITGEGIETLARRLVLAPLGMDASTFVWTERCADRCANGHDAAGRPVDKWRPDVPLAFASLHTTAGEYSRFLAALTAPDWSGPLGRDLVDQMLTPTTHVRDGLDWGLGWGIQRGCRGDLFWHWGDNSCFKASAIGSRAERLAVVVLTNGANGLTLCERVACAVFGDVQPAFGWLRDFYA